MKFPAPHAPGLAAGRHDPLQEYFKRRRDPATGVVAYVDPPPDAERDAAFRDLQARVAPLEAAASAHRDAVRGLADRCRAGWGGGAEANGRRPAVAPAARRRLYTAAEGERVVAAGAAAIAGWYDLLTATHAGADAESAVRHVMLVGGDWSFPGDPPVIALLQDAGAVAALRRAFYDAAFWRAVAGRPTVAEVTFFLAGAAAAKSDNWDLFQAAMTMPRRGTMRPPAGRSPSGIVRFVAHLWEARRVDQPIDAPGRTLSGMAGSRP
ncbi:hypothetical protein [Limnoglobus roseus]|uniref:Uncharacterized protein n=1 Tax=Limnoglobus roseus TaxID=2598579 RepID=A0A5C1AI72_9BACT|nr:hypothetical protein [Limnoglobus roseus]QEL16658.1 hypothetical protein PX52LOC_03619 [Limnoglobus roseus]